MKRTATPLFLFLMLFFILKPAAAAAQDNGAQEVIQQTIQQTIQQARELKNLYKTDEAISLLSALLAEGLTAQGTVDETVLAELADCHYQNGDWQSAIEYYTLLSDSNSRKPFYKIRLMVCFSKLKQYAQTAALGKAVTELDSIPAIMALTGDAFNFLEQPDSALVWYNSALALKPADANVASKVARIHLDRKEYDKVIEVADSLLARLPDNMIVAPVKGLALYCKGDYEPAIEVLKRQLEVGNDSYGVHFYLGQSYWQTKYFIDAEKELEKAWQLDSSDVNLAFSIARVKSGFRSFDKSVRPWLDKALEMLQPDGNMISSVEQQYGLGYYMTTKWPEAIEHYKESYNYNPKNISALSTIAYCYEQMKQYKNALEWFEKYLKVATPGSKGYNFAKDEVNYIKGELFMEE